MYYINVTLQVGNYVVKMAAFEDTLKSSRFMALSAAVGECFAMHSTVR
jgi:hypothetical protein